MKTRVVQKALLFSQDGELLLLRRSKTDLRRPLQWDFPGGLLDEDEDLEACINREIKEETSLEAKNLYPIYAKTEIRDWKDKQGEHTENVVFVFYVGESAKTEPKLSFEHDKFLWIKPKEALNEIEYYLHKEVLEHILKNDLIDKT